MLFLNIQKKEYTTGQDFESLVSPQKLVKSEAPNYNTSTIFYNTDTLTELGPHLITH